MMMTGIVFVNRVKAGSIIRTDEGTYVFQYDNDYFTNQLAPAISLTLPKTQIKYESAALFPFFFGLLAEGVNKDIQCRLLKIDQDDDFTRLLKTAGSDTIGAVTIQEETK